jgi:hypothetical protein
MITSKLRHTYTDNPETKTPDIGLANRLFQISAGIGYAKKYGFECVFPDILHPNYDIHRDNIFSRLNDNNGSKDFVRENYSYMGYGYKEIPPIPNVELNGWFQSWKYFSGAEQEVRDAFKIPEHISEYFNDKYSDILNKKTVSVHVRRGIQAADEAALRQYPQAGADYISEAISRFDSSYTFVLFSDGHDWCRENLRDDVPFVHIENETEVNDLYLMSLMHHNIIYNSTFSWWAAWLNQNKDKKIITPNIWYGPDNPWPKSPDEDLIPNNWIRI